MEYKEPLSIIHQMKSVIEVQGLCCHAEYQDTELQEKYMGKWDIMWKKYVIIWNKNMGYDLTFYWNRSLAWT